MTIFELNTVLPNINALLDAVQVDDVLLVRDGHAVMRIEKFDDEDWEDWKYEHSAEAISLGDAARRQYRDGEFRSSSEVRERRDGES